MRDAFTRAAGDDGTLSVDEVPVMLRILYHGDAPRRETERIMAAVDEATDEGRRIDWPGFQALIAELYGAWALRRPAPAACRQPPTAAPRPSRPALPARSRRGRRRGRGRREGSE